MRFGLFVPQGWRLDLAGINPKDHWNTMLDVARIADAGPYESVWVYDHFHTTPEPTQEATHEPGPAGPDVHVHGLPEPGVPGEGRGDCGRHLRWPDRNGHRRRLVRARVA